MARIPDAEIERLKKEVAMERLVMGFGVELKRHGAEWIGRCPFHEDKTPSLVVSPKTNLWHCLGKCQYGVMSRFLALLGLLALILPAQKLDPVRWTLGPFPAAAAGQEIKIPVRAHIAEHWHLYSLTTPPPPKPTRIQAPEDAPFELIRVVQPAPERKFDPNFGSDTETFDNDVEFTLVARATRDIPANDPELAVEVRYQSCDDKQCMPPRKKSIRFEPDSPTPTTPAPTTTAAVPPGTKPLGEFLLLAFGFGLASVLTPCVFPMIPITMSFFLTKQNSSRARMLADATTFCLGIVVLFTALGFALTALLGTAGVTSIGSNVWVNSFISAIFFALSLSLLGAYEITLPSALLTRLNSASAGGGAAGTLLMGLTFSLTSFACVGPFVGTLLAASITGDRLQPTLGMMAFSFGLSLPFFFLALFPGFLQGLPRAGNWMIRIKVVMGFFILAAMLKYLSNVDAVLGWNLLTRERFLALWAVLFSLPGLYLLGKLAMDGIKPGETLGAGRALAGALLIALALSLLPGMFGANLGELEAYVPFPRENASLLNQGAQPALPWIKNDLDAALARAKAENKLVFVNFTGVACTNCHWMKANMFTKPAIHAAMEKFVLVELYTDELDDPRSQAFQQWQESLFQTVGIPYYAVFNPGKQLLASFPGLTKDPAEFAAFLNSALAKI
ncbi:MAG: cytochrome c biogenesis protein CcdA [bacterium]